MRSCRAAVARPDAGHQAELRGVGQLDGLVLVAEAHGGQHRAEHFLLRQAVIDRHVAQQRGRLVVSRSRAPRRPPALRHHRDARHLRVGQEIPDALLLAGADQRADVQVHRRRADAQVLEGLAQPLQQRLVDGLLDQQARAGRAGLAGVLHDGVDDHRQGGVEVGVGKDDLRALAAQLQRDRAVALGGHLLDQGAHVGTAGEADVVDAFVCAPARRPLRGRSPSRC